MKGLETAKITVKVSRTYGNIVGMSLKRICCSAH